jgi:hypothetical protein
MSAFGLHTLRIHEVRDGHWVIPLNLNPWRLEHGLRMSLRADTEILLAKMLRLRCDRKRFLINSLGDGVVLMVER